MEEQRTPETEADATPPDAAIANATARAGATARGGTAPQPGDPTSPAEADARAAQRNREMREAGFGDHKGERI